MPDNNIPSMTPPVVHDYLRGIGESWRGQGVAVELGSWLGASAVALISGLVRKNYDKPFYAFDRWQATREEVAKAAEQGVEITEGQDLLPAFMANVTQVYWNFVAVKGQIGSRISDYPGDAIEVCLFDAPKRDPLFGQCVRRLAPHWIPDVTIVGLLDYYAYRKHPERAKVLQAPVRLIEENAGCFRKLAEWPDQCSCVFFKYVESLKRI